MAFATAAAGGISPHLARAPHAERGNRRRDLGVHEEDGRDVAGGRCEVVHHRAVQELAGLGVVEQLLAERLAPRPCTSPPRTCPSISLGFTGVPQSWTMMKPLHVELAGLGVDGHDRGRRPERVGRLRRVEVRRLLETGHCALGRPWPRMASVNNLWQRHLEARIASMPDGLPDDVELVRVVDLQHAGGDPQRLAPADGCRLRAARRRRR